LDQIVGLGWVNLDADGSSERNIESSKISAKNKAAWRRVSAVRPWRRRKRGSLNECRGELRLPGTPDFIACSVVALGQCIARRPSAERYCPWEPTALHEFLSSFEATHNRQHGGHVGAVSRSECQSIVPEEISFVIEFSPEKASDFGNDDNLEVRNPVSGPLFYSAIGEKSNAQCASAATNTVGSQQNR
jgi:hypothetical protein